jgi:hypothetical protein
MPISIIVGEQHNRIIHHHLALTLNALSTSTSLRTGTGSGQTDENRNVERVTTDVDFSWYDLLDSFDSLVEKQAEPNQERKKEAGRDGR